MQTSLHLPRSRSITISGLAVLLAALVTSLGTPARATVSHAQAVPDGAATPEALADLVANRFAAGPPEAFERVFPFAPGREFVAEASQRNATRHAGLAKVLQQDEDEALLLLSGYTTRGHSGVETLLSQAYSDFYRAARRGDRWILTERLPLDAESRIVTQQLDVTIVPGERLQVKDTLAVLVTGNRGFAARLDHAAEISGVTVDGRSVEALFAGGLLWVPMTPDRQATLTVTYDLALPDDPDSWLSYALPKSGFIRDQALWHPVLNYNTPADRASFGITARIPATFHLSTSVTQEVVIADGWRVARARTRESIAGLSLAYDSEWSPYVIEADGLRLEAFVASGFQPGQTQLDAVFQRTFRVLTSAFGPPRAGDYFAVVQRREAPSSGWHMLSNAAMITGRNGGPTTSTAPASRAFVAHELAHRWTAPTGPGAMLLMEGWATFAESLVLADEFGPEVERAFWQSQRQAYHRGGFEGTQSILGDTTNGGIAYSKGAWIFRMLRDDLGQAAFDRGMRAYLDISADQDTGVAAFAHALSSASGRNVTALLRPWLEERTTPAIEVDLGPRQITLRQIGPLFDVPLEVDLVTAESTSRRRVRVTSRETTLELPQQAQVTAVILDPEGKLLLARDERE